MTSHEVESDGGIDFGDVVVAEVVDDCALVVLVVAVDIDVDAVVAAAAAAAQTKEHYQVVPVVVLPFQE